MGLFDKIKEIRREKAVKKHKSVRREYLLNEKTPFDVTEAFRNLKASLSVSMPAKQGGAAITVTSSYPEDGKTTVTANLALMFAMSDAKVVLIDADIRKGRIAKYFKTKSNPGLSDYLSGLVNLDEILHTSEINENLSYIPCGTHSPKPYELLESEKMTQLLEELKTKFDYIVIDTPPILLVSDSLAVAPKTDGTVLVCRHNLSYVSDMERSLSTLSFAKANVLGIVVNDYHNTQGKGYGYGSYHGYYHYSKYSYGYGYSYGSTDPDKSPDDDDQNSKNS
ncbi:MAG: CpsD/CapB family tyrosine-protein kinase [Clostridia bacterium]|nr:CpsD/CapB family tyrosine-protein kinase [Clostridia bacterium]